MLRINQWTNNVVWLNWGNSTNGHGTSRHRAHRNLSMSICSMTSIFQQDKATASFLVDLLCLLSLCLARFISLESVALSMVLSTLYIYLSGPILLQLYGSWFPCKGKRTETSSTNSAHIYLVYTQTCLTFSKPALLSIEILLVKVTTIKLNLEKFL